MDCGIYEISNIKTKQFYIGSSIDLYKRLKNHKNELLGNRHPNKKLQNSFNKYGIDNFKFEILEYCSPNECISLEQEYIDIFEPYYNICKIAYSRLGTKHSEETKNKISKNQLGKPKPKVSEKMKGKIKDSYTIQQIIKANSKEVDQYSIDGEFIKSWKSIKEAADCLNIKHSSISNCLHGRYKTAGKFKWIIKNNINN